MQRLVQGILFDNYVRETCKSEMALAFLMRGFPNYTQLHQGLSQWFLSLGYPQGIGTCGTQSTGWTANQLKEMVPQHLKICMGL